MKTTVSELKALVKEAVDKLCEDLKTKGDDEIDFDAEPDEKFKNKFDMDDQTTTTKIANASLYATPFVPDEDPDNYLNITNMVPLPFQPNAGKKKK